MKDPVSKLYIYYEGGGLGRDGGGISEPITAKSIFGREGLGKDI